MLISCMTLGSEQTLSDLQITYHFGRHLVSSSPTCGAILNIIPGLALSPYQTITPYYPPSWPPLMHTVKLLLYLHTMLGQ